jgi:hypothetical protein
MKTAKVQAMPAPPSLVGSLMAGFDAIANHFDLVVIPVLFDLFLWFGPHLRLGKLLEGLIAEFFTQPGMGASDTSELIRMSTEFWRQVAQNFNLFAILRSYPIGVPSLLAGSQPVVNPLGLPVAWDLSALWQAMVLWLLFSLVGLGAGTLYFSMISQAALSGRVSWQTAIQRWPWEAGQVLLLALSWLVFLLILSIPASCLVSTIVLTGMNLGGFALFIFTAMGIYILFPLLFTPHGIFANHSPLRASIQSSLRITRLSLPKTALFVAAVLLIDAGFTLLWQMPAADSWLALIGVIGHAFIVTGLIAASFVYYRDATRWQHRLAQQAQLSSHL